MEATNTEIARVAVCSEGAVRKAVERGKLNLGSLESVAGFCLAMRVKQVGLGGLDELLSVDIPEGVQVGCEGIGEYVVDYSESQEEAP